MQKRMINKRRMYLAVVDFLDKNKTRLDFAPALPAYVDALQDTLSQISTMLEAQLATSEGHTKTKEAQRHQLIASILELAKRAKAFAVVTDNKVLFEAVNYSYTKLRRLPQASLAGAVKSIINTCKPYISDLAAYGLNDEMQLQVEQKINAYTATLPGTKRAIASRKTATDKLQKLFGEVNLLLKKIDVLMEIINTTDPLFYREYKNLRLIDDLKRKAPDKGYTEVGVSGDVSEVTIME